MIQINPVMACVKQKKQRAGVRCCMVLLAAFSTTGFASACFAAADNDNGSVQEIRNETLELLAALKTYTADQRNEALSKIKTAQANLDRRIEALERNIAQNWNEMDQAAREKSNASLQALRERRILVAEYYGSLKSGSTAAWDHIKQGFSDAYRALHDALERAENQSDADK